MIEPGAPTPSIWEFQAEYAKDDNLWWRTECGHHQNLFESAMDKLEQIKALADENLPSDQHICPADLLAILESE